MCRLQQGKSLELEGIIRLHLSSVVFVLMRREFYDVWPPSLSTYAQQDTSSHVYMFMYDYILHPGLLLVYSVKLLSELHKSVYVEASWKDCVIPGHKWCSLSWVLGIRLLMSVFSNFMAATFNLINCWFWK